MHRILPVEQSGFSPLYPMQQQTARRRPRRSVCPSTARLACLPTGAKGLDLQDLAPVNGHDIASAPLRNRSIAVTDR